MNIASHVDQQTDEKEICTVVVVYQDGATRQRAMDACDFLMEKLWSEVEFNFHWWRTDFLEQPAMAQTAAEEAAGADFLIVCSNSEYPLSPALKRWFESWVEMRQGRDGALLDLMESGVAEAATSHATGTFLRGIARRATLDYFTTAQETLMGTLPASYEEVDQRASQMSSVLDDILNQPPRPPSFGLND